MPSEDTHEPRSQCPTQSEKGNLTMQLDVDVSDRVGTITLNRPEARNALSGELTHLLDEAIVELDRREDVGAMILTGADPAFCAGFDLRALADELSSVAERHRTSSYPH